MKVTHLTSLSAVFIYKHITILKMSLSHSIKEIKRNQFQFIETYPTAHNNILTAKAWDLTSVT